LGSFFSTSEIDIYIHHNRRLQQADEAEYRNWNRKRYGSTGYSLAA
jgi:hypothetical protein